MTSVEAQDMVPTYVRLREVERSIKELQDERAFLLEQLTPIGNADFTYGDEHVIAKVVQRSRAVVNLPKLQMLDPSMFERVTKTVVDTSKLNRSLDAHEWDPSLIDECITVVDDKPYIKFTDYLATPQEEQE